VSEVLAPQIVERMQADGLPPPAGVYGQLAAVTTHYVSKDRLAVIKKAGIPVVIMTGTDDTLVRPINSHILKSILEPAEFHIFEGAGHGISVECADDFHQLIIRNFRRGIERYLSSHNSMEGAMSQKESDFATNVGARDNTASEKENGKTEAEEAEEEEEEEEHEDVTSLKDSVRTISMDHLQATLMG